MKVATVAERPDLVEPGWVATKDVLPEYNNHGDVLDRYWGRLTEERPDFQFHLVGDGDEILARARSIPVRWNGSVEDLPAGIDGAIARGFDEGGANVLCALIIMVPRGLQGRGLSAVAVQAMADLARGHELGALIAPVRPSRKDRYPLVPIERYAEWHRADGLLLDPWMRVHERLGARVLRPEPQSLRITGTVAEWEEWTGIVFPESGKYWFPAVSRPSRSTAMPTVAATGSRTCGWSTSYKVRRFPHKQGVFGVTKLVCSGWMEGSARRPFQPAGAGGLLLGVLLATIAVGLLVGWAVGSIGIGILIGAVIGIPLGVFAVYRRYSI